MQRNRGHILLCNGPSRTQPIIPAPASGGLFILVTPTTLKYDATAEIDHGNGQMEQPIRISYSVTPFQRNNGALDTLDWLLDNVHMPSFSSPVFLEISEMESSQAIISILDRLSSVITMLELTRIDKSPSRAVLSYLAEPCKVVVGGNTTLRWPLPKLMDLSVEGCDGLGPEVVLSCVKRRSGRELPLKEGGIEHCAELPARLSELRLPRGFSARALMRMFPDCMEWSGLHLEGQEQ
ncbi:hypothetical protein FRB93_012212 [Tulasnella sp. JGI-2019a]|nr:hypothetical protein FRB93_012212 [Tulasnella sp. JGI-2019a]